MRLVRQFAAAVAGAAAATAFLAYCGGTPPAGADGADAGKAACDCPTPVVRSGSRLRARVLRSEDGASEFVGWYDSVFKAPCAVSTRNGFKDACLPAIALRWFWDQASNAYFADAGCSVPGVAIGVGDGTTDAPLCGTAGEIRRIGEVVPVLYRHEGASCVEAHDVLTDQEGTVFRRCDGAPVTRSDFALLVPATD